MADIILIQPRLGEMDFLRTQPFLPLNLLHAATLVDKEYKIKILDQRIDKNWQKTLSEELLKAPLCVGIVAYTGKIISHALEISRFVKKRVNVPVVWGGIHASLLPEQTLKSKYIDIVVQGEGEVTFLELVRAMEKGKSLKGIEGVWFKNNGEIQRNPPRGFLNLNELPEIPYHLVDVHRYAPVYKGRPSLSLQTSRGCIYHCVYCYNNSYNHSKWRSLTAENTLKRIRYIVDKFNIKSIYIIDDNFFIDLERAEDIARRIIKENLNIEWHVQGGPDFNALEKMGEDFLRLLEKSGCVRISCGVESGNAGVRSKLNKGSNPDKIIKMNKMISKYKIIVYYSFMTGLPGESKDDLRQTISILFRLLKDNKNARSSPIYPFIPFPGIPLTQLLENKGYKSPAALNEWQNYDFDNFRFSDVPYISDEIKKILKNNSLYLISFFVDEKLREYKTSKIIRLLALIYRPIARFRIRHLFLKLPFESKIIDLFFKLKLKNKT